MTSNPYFNPIPTPLKPSSTGFSFSPPKLLFPNSPRIFPISRPAIHGSSAQSFTMNVVPTPGRDVQVTLPP